MNLPVSLDEEVRLLARAARSANTLRAYKLAMRKYSQWCEARGYQAIPPAPSTVAAFLVHEAQSGVAISTIGQHSAAMAAFCRMAHLENPINDHVKEVLRGVRRTYGVAQKGKRPLLAEDIRQIVSAIGRNEEKPTRGKWTRHEWDVRDRALLLLGFAGAFRRSELVALNVEDLESASDGLLVHIRRSKTDQEGKGQVVAIVPTGNEFCPVQAVFNLIEQLGRAEGPLFIHDERRISDFALAIIIKRRARLAGLDPKDISGHSLRSGFVTSASLNGANLFKVMEVSRHKSVESVRKYFKSDLFENHAAKGLL